MIPRYLSSPRPAHPAGLLLLFLSALLPAACSSEQNESEAEEEISELARPVELTEEQLAAIEKLESIGYVGGGESALDERMVGVLKYDREAAQPGLNFFTSGHAPVAILMDMEGRELHQWESSLQRTFPGVEPPTPEELEENSRLQSWRRARPFPNGDVIGIFDGEGIFRLDRDSNVLWSRLIGSHHDFRVLPDGRIYTLVGESGLVPRIHPDKPVKLDFVVVLDSEGRELERFPIYEAYENSPYADQLKPRNPDGDIMHTNALTVFDGALSHLSPIYAKGNVLLSIREMSTVGILNPDEGRMVWAQRGPWKFQHEPVLLENGRVLVFDNLGGPSEDHLSRIIEADPRSGTTTVYYGEEEGEGFGCGYLGSHSRLENGNTLIVHSLGGLVFEITPEKETVWKFQTPYYWGKYGERVAVIFDMIRLPSDFFDPGVIEESRPSGP